jgi:hypothetical protein
MGISDDWSYIQIAQNLARTGHILYNGWVTPVLGWQLYLAAAFIKLFGFSFTAPRMSTLLIGCLTAFLLHRTLVRLGLTERNATLGTLTFVLSPLFMMLAVTFMTDVPGFFGILLCFYACIRALQADSDQSAILWLAFAVLGNYICGSSRQIAWLGALVLVPSALYLLRSRRVVLLSGLAIAALGFAAVFTTMHWFAHQPYTQAEPFTLSFAKYTTAVGLFTHYARALLEMTLLLLPITLAYLWQARRWPRNILAFAALLVVVATALYALHPRSDWNFLLNPFMGEWLGIRGTFEAVSLIGQPPIVIGHYPHILLGVLTLGSLFSIAVAPLLPRRATATTSQTPISAHRLLCLFGPFSLAYAVLLIHRAEQTIYDRYLLAPIFILLCLLLRFYQSLQPRLPAASAVALGFLAFYGVISTHNIFALNRARIAITQQILATGVPDTAIDFGWEQDGWIELQHATYVNGPNITTPPHASRYIPVPQRRGCYENLPVFGLFPHLAPQFGVAFDPNACDGPAPFAPVSYSTWPLRHPTTLYIVRYPGPWKPESSYAEPATPASTP